MIGSSNSQALQIYVRLFGGARSMEVETGRSPLNLCMIIPSEHISTYAHLYFHQPDIDVIHGSPSTKWETFTFKCRCTLHLNLFPTDMQ